MIETEAGSKFDEIIGASDLESLLDAELPQLYAGNAWEQAAKDFEDAWWESQK